MKAHKSARLQEDFMSDHGGDTPLSAGWRDYPRYPDPAIHTLDPRFEKYRIFSAAVERLYTGCRWSEGPVWFGDVFGFANGAAECPRSRKFFTGRSNRTGIDFAG